MWRGGFFVAQNARAGWWLKLDHGKEQFDQLQLEVNLWMAEHQGQLPWRPRYEYDPDLQCIRVFVDSISPLPPRWGLLLGDALHNVRCALDHMAWYLVASGRSPPRKIEDQRRVGFPIYDTISGFSSGVRARIPGVAPAQQAVIERHQPYHLGKTAGTHSLAVLQDLNNTDKHRELRTLALAKGGKFRFDLIAPMGSQLDRAEIVPAFTDDVLIKVGTEVTRAYGRFAEGEATVTFTTVTGIALDNGLDPKSTFDAIYAEVTVVLRELEAAF
jgi:hypothetical protein